MKKNLFIIILLHTIAFSQLALTGGMTYSKISFNEEPPEGFDIIMSPGFKIGVETPPSKLITGVAYTQRGSAAEYEMNFIGYSLETLKSKITYNYLTAYALMALLPPSSKLNLYFGGEVGTFLSGKLVESVSSMEVEEEDEDEITRAEWERNGNSLFDYGLLLGTRYHLNPNMSLNANYYLGLANLNSPESSTKAVNHGLQFTLSFGEGAGSASSAKRGGFTSSSGDGGGCTAPSKKYGNADLDNFLQTSYDICVSLKEAEKLLSEVNEFLENPNLYVTKKVSQEISKVKNQVEEVSNLGETVSKEIEDAIIKQKDYLKTQLLNMVKEKLPGIITGVGKALGDSGGALDGAKGLPGMDKLKAAKDAASAVKNLKTIADTSPKVLDELNSLLSKF